MTKREELEMMRLAAISTAAIGYWKEGDTIHDDYKTAALLDVAKLYQKYEQLHTAARMAMNELGVPGDGYPQNVANAYDHLHRAYYAGIECIFDENDYRPKPLPESADPSHLVAA